MTKHFDDGDKVEWDWGNGTATGIVRQKYTQKHTLKINGSEVTRDADEDDPAYRLEQSDGQTVLKKHTEIRKAG